MRLYGGLTSLRGGLLYLSLRPLSYSLPYISRRPALLSLPLQLLRESYRSDPLNIEVTIYYLFRILKVGMGITRKNHILILQYIVTTYCSAKSCKRPFYLVSDWD